MKHLQTWEDVLHEPSAGGVMLPVVRRLIEFPSPMTRTVKPPCSSIPAVALERSSPDSAAPSLRRECPCRRMVIPRGVCRPSGGRTKRGTFVGRTRRVRPRISSVGERVERKRPITRGAACHRGRHAPRAVALMPIWPPQQVRRLDGTRLELKNRMEAPPLTRRRRFARGILSSRAKDRGG